MMQWLKRHWDTVRATIAAGDARTIERKYLPAAVGFGVLLGGLLAYLSYLIAVMVFMLAGFALGYAVRSYVSHRRRQRFMQERM